MSYFAPMEAKTKIPCPECGALFHARRDCFKTWLECPVCHARQSLEKALARGDRALEEFLDNIPCDRL